MSEADIIRRWGEDRPIFSAWGQFIIDEVQEGLRGSMRSEQMESFLRIPPKARLKSDDSLIEKALYRNKPYKDPYQDITDKVGVRFVVLLSSEIELVEQVIRAHDAWTFSKDKDFEKEREEDPFQFSYQSIHYVLSSRHDVEVEGVRVPIGTPCEVQIRTLLQHAHSELSHPNIYKPKTQATPEMKRASATSMALVEAADDYFRRVANVVVEANRPLDDALRVACNHYQRITKRAPVIGKLTSLVLDAYREKLGDVLDARLTTLLSEKPYLGERINERAQTKAIYRQPVIVLMQLFAAKEPNATMELWPLTPNELSPIYEDVGRVFDPD
jgi:ppGpp synthetase/RelA/SpoT-type nucleotidyltranferase